MDDAEKPPIISLLKDEQVAERKVIGGYGENLITRVIYGEGESEKSVVFKPLKNEAEARQNQDIYHRLREANLPVVRFMKTIRKAGKDGTLNYSLAMEDLTQGGKLKIDEFVIIGCDKNIRDLFIRMDNQQNVQREIISSVGVLHNNGIIHTHPGSSICVRTDAATGQYVDFMFIDYMNFANTNRPNYNDIYPIREVDEVMKMNMVNAIINMTGDPEVIDELKQVYNTTRSEQRMKM